MPQEADPDLVLLYGDWSLCVSMKSCCTLWLLDFGLLRISAQSKLRGSPMPNHIQCASYAGSGLWSLWLSTADSAQVSLQVLPSVVQTNSVLGTYVLLFEAFSAFFYLLVNLVTSLNSSVFSVILSFLSVNIPAVPVRSTMMKIQRKHTVNIRLIKGNTRRCCRRDPGELMKSKSGSEVVSAAGWVLLLMIVTHSCRRDSHWVFIFIFCISYSSGSHDEQLEWNMISAFNTLDQSGNFTAVIYSCSVGSWWESFMSHW